MNEDSPCLKPDDLHLIYSHLQIKLKKHQEMSIKAMLSLEQDGKIFVNLNSKILKNEIILKDDRQDNPYYMWYTREINVNDFKLQKFEINTNFGILADKVGAGKTFEILGLLSHTQTPIDHPKILTSSYYSMIKWYDIEKSIKTNLIIVPHNLILQWEKALDYINLKKYVIKKRTNIDKLKSIYNVNENGNDDINNATDVAFAQTLVEDCNAKDIKVLLMKASATSYAPLETLALGTSGLVTDSYDPETIIESIQNICL
jgi:SNF2 family DNA or RNA helicase